ncbi:MAG: glycosyltransferase [Aeromicrobium sp.]|nr:MAG: glycosyltransferase [Aeromicrobium sp.]
MPRFSVITPVYNVPARVFRDTARSVLNQSFSDWEWVLVDDASPQNHVRASLRKVANSDPRVKVITAEQNGGIVSATNIAIEHAAGEFIALLDHDDLLDPHALESVHNVLSEDESIDMVYTDEDKLSPLGRHYDRVRKPIWSPEKLRGQMYVGHLGVYRADLVRAVGGFRKECEGSQDHDLALRVSEQARSIRHIPEVLYHWRVVPGSTAATVENKPYTWKAGLKAVEDHLERIGLDATASFGPHPSHYTVNRRPDLSTPVSIIIPTRGSSGMVDASPRTFILALVQSLLRTNTHQQFELVVVYDTGTPDAVLQSLQRLAGDSLLLVEYSKPFNFSEKCNLGALHATHETLLFLNDDMECITEEAIGQLIAPLNEPEVGATGARLLFEDGTVQHGGHKHDMGEYTLNYYGAPNNFPGEFGAMLINREVSGVTGACIALRKSLFTRVGGFSELFPNSYNDVDLCNKITSTGSRILWLANTVLRHFESKSRTPVVDPGDYLRIQERWGAARDPYYA